MLKIPVYFGDAISTKLANLPDWESTGSEQFISFIEKLLGSKFSDRVRRFAKAESLIKREGKVIGRAFLHPSLSSNISPGFYELGIFVGYNRPSSGVCGFVNGRAKNAARDRIDGFDAVGDSDWIEKQIDYMTRISENIGDALACQAALISNGRIARRLQVVLLNRNECSLDELIAELGKRNKVKFVLSDRGEDGTYGAQVIDSAAPFIGKEVDEDRLYFLVDFPDKTTADDLEPFIINGAGPLAQLLREIKIGLGGNVKIRGTLVDADGYSKRQVLAVEIYRGSVSSEQIVDEHKGH